MQCSYFLTKIRWSNSYGNWQKGINSPLHLLLLQDFVTCVSQPQTHVCHSSNRLLFPSLFLSRIIINCLLLPLSHLQGPDLGIPLTNRATRHNCGKHAFCWGRVYFAFISSISLDVISISIMNDRKLDAICPYLYLLLSKKLPIRMNQPTNFLLLSLSSFSIIQHVQSLGFVEPFNFTSLLLSQLCLHLYALPFYQPLFHNFRHFYFIWLSIHKCLWTLLLVLSQFQFVFVLGFYVRQDVKIFKFRLRHMKKNWVINLHLVTIQFSSLLLTKFNCPIT